MKVEYLKERILKDSELATLIAKRYMLSMFSTPTVFLVDGQEKTAWSEENNPEIKHLETLIEARISQIKEEIGEVR